MAKPTRHGPAVSVEGFDAAGGLILQIFGQRTPDTAAWQALTETLPALESVEA